MESLKKYIKENRQKVLVTLFCFITLLVSIIVRYPSDSKVYFDCDASYHTLLTIRAYDETPASVHKFLPLVSLGDENDKGIPWGKTVEKDGNYYYTSFSAASFFIAYVFFKLLHLPLTLRGLYVLNCFLYIGSVLLAVRLALKLFHGKFPDGFIAVISVLIFGFQTEILHSMGAIYWAQSIFQIVFTVQMLLFLSFDSKKRRIAFFALCLFVPFLEWSGYITNVGFAAAFMIRDGFISEKKLNLKALKTPALIGALTAAAFLLFVLHFSIVLDFGTVVRVLRERFLVRSAAAKYATTSLLLSMYWKSFGLFIPLTAAALTAALSMKETRARLRELIKEYKLILIISTFAIPENFLLKEHAIVYTYDRMKVLFFLFFVFMLCLIALGKYICERQYAVCALFFALACFNLFMYAGGDRFNSGFYVRTVDYADDNAFAAECLEKFDPDECVIAQTASTRGYTNLLFGRGVYEECSEEKAAAIALQKGKRYVILFMPEDGEFGINKYSRVKVINVNDGSSVSYKIKNRQILETEEF